MRNKWTIAALALLAVTTSGYAAGVADLHFGKATMETVNRETVVDGVLEAVNQATVSAQTSGRITHVYFDVDDYVKKGDVLVRFRDKQQKAALAAAQAKAEEAQSNFNRTKELLNKKLVSKAQYDSAKAALKAANAAVDQAQDQLEHTVVRAPYAGIVVKRHVEPGESANPGQPLMTGISLEKLRAVASVSQAHIAAVRQFSQAKVILPNQDLPATKITISPYADPATHSFKVRVDLPDGQHGLYPGMFAKVAFVTGQEQRLVVDAAAIVHRSEVTGVYVRGADGALSLRQVRIGDHTPDGKVEVLAGLDAGEEVALDPILAGILLKNKAEGKE